MGRMSIYLFQRGKYDSKITTTINLEGTLTINCIKMRKCSEKVEPCRQITWLVANLLNLQK